MIQLIWGGMIGGILAALPTLVLWLFARERVEPFRIHFVLIAGTATIVGAIMGSTSAILDSFRKSRGRGRRESSSASHE